jgi:hypothetical protein
MPDNDLKFVYIHNPKSGGTYVKRCLEHNSNVLFPDEEFSTGTIMSKKLNEYRKDSSYIIFSTVRNPFDHLVSYYTSNFYTSFYRGSIPSFVDYGELEWYKPDGIRTFSEFVNWFINFSKDDANAKYYQYHQSNFLYYQLYDEGCNRCLADVLIKQETLERDLMSFCVKNGLDFKEPVSYSRNKSKKVPGRVNTSRGPDDCYREYYTDEMVEKVQIHFKKELDLLDYSFE